MLDDHFRALTVIAVALGIASAPCVVQAQLCVASNVTINSEWAGASWNSNLNGYQIQGGCNYTFDCPKDDFGSCEVCWMVEFSLNGVGQVDQWGIGASAECNSVGNKGSFSVIWPQLGTGVGSNVPYQIDFYAMGDYNPYECGDLNPSHYPAHASAGGTTPPF